MTGRPANLAIRALAGSLDLALLACFAGALIGLAGWGGSIAVANHPNLTDWTDLTDWADVVDPALWGPLTVGMAILGSAATCHLLGATPGGLLFGCEVVDWRSRSRLGWVRAGWRMAGAVVLFAPVGLGLLSALSRPDGRAWYDRLSGSRVIIEDEASLTLAELARKLP